MHVVLSDEQVAANAEAVVELLKDRLVAAAGSSPYVAAAEAAEYLRCSRERIDDLLSARRLTRIKEGRRTLIARREIDAYLKSEQRP